MSEHREHCREGWIHPVPDHACTCERRSGERRKRPQNDDPTTWRRGHPPYGGPHRHQQERRA